MDFEVIIEKALKASSKDSVVWEELKRELKKHCATREIYFAHVERNSRFFYHKLSVAEHKELDEYEHGEGDKTAEMKESVDLIYAKLIKAHKKFGNRMYGKKAEEVRDDVIPVADDYVVFDLVEECPKAVVVLSDVRRVMIAHRLAQFRAMPRLLEELVPRKELKDVYKRAKSFLIAKDSSLLIHLPNSLGSSISRFDTFAQQQEQHSVCRWSGFGRHGVDW